MKLSERLYSDTLYSGSDPLGEATLRRTIAENAEMERLLQGLGVEADSHSVMSVTDRNGIILEVDDRFLDLSGYTREELIGAPQSIVRLDQHPDSFFREMWDTIAKGEVWQGAICNRAKDGSEYWVDTTIVPLTGANGEIERYLAVHADVTRMQYAEGRMRELAYTDQLTGLPNRVRMLNHLNSSALSSGTDRRVYVTAAFDDLGMINETFGFAAGDRFLRRVATRLGELAYAEAAATCDERPLARCPELVARIGSAAFGAAFSGLDADAETATPEIEALAIQFGTMLENIMKAELGSSIEPIIKVSYVDYVPGSGLDGADIFSRAAVARRYGPRAPRPGAIQPATFEQSIMDDVRARADLVLDLRRSVSEGNLRLYLQPVVTVDRVVCGYEGLVRWVNPDGEMLLPGEFISLAERTGIIIEIGDWVLDEACRILAEWAKDPETRDYTIAVNVSERQLRPEALVESVRAALGRHGARPDRLKLEVTESQLHADLERSVEILQVLRAEGVQISLDDFGTGYSSLNHLNSLPVDQLKIDRSFVTSITGGVTNMAIVAAIVHLARLMRLSVVAEGVETEEQFEALVSLGVDAYQGYLFGRPAPHEI